VYGWRGAPDVSNAPDVFCWLRVASQKPDEASKNDLMTLRINPREEGRVSVMEWIGFRTEITAAYQLVRLDRRVVAALERIGSEEMCRQLNQVRANLLGAFLSILVSHRYEPAEFYDLANQLINTGSGKMLYNGVWFYVINDTGFVIKKFIMMH
jgi:hypothetical protein